MFIRTENFQAYIRSFPAVSGLILFFVLIFVLTLFPGPLGQFIYINGTGVNLYIENGQWWRLATPIFLHGSFTHLLLNSFSLAIFGPGLEKLIGSARFILFFLTAGILASAATYLFHPLTYSHVGASGAIFGVLGFYVYLAAFKKSLFTANEVNTIYTLTVIGVIMTFIQPQINATGHIAGLAAGFITARLFWNKR
ncbi:rhomboid family intramembrane serine protease [Bacillus massiliglaciei]|uniref:rhomboid family intramembrane serine protease n=1 Tax=Bacillus massiliglaciei TaxID=1816693 RepID=UPI000A64154C|nr:rhomboid family intramembrane serine protease [Bacillus massiliglaciei]